MNMPSIRPLLNAQAVIDAYAARAGVSASVLLAGYPQTRWVTEHRHRLMWLLRDLTQDSFETIGETFHRHPSTVLEAVNRLSDRLAIDVECRVTLREMRERIMADCLKPPSLALDKRAVGARALAVIDVLRDPDLTDAEARTAALQIMSTIATTENLSA